MDAGLVSTQQFLDRFEAITQGISQCGDVFSALLPALGEKLACDRVFLYLRHPPTRRGCSPFCWRRDNSIPLIHSVDWTVEPPELPQEDPLFAAALQTRPSIFVDDVETADASTLNRQFEQENFGHRALIHAHVCHQNQLWGILQPCVFGQPRHWTAAEQSLMQDLVHRLVPYVIQYVTETFPHDC